MEVSSDFFEIVTTIGKFIFGGVVLGVLLMVAISFIDRNPERKPDTTNEKPK